MTPSDVTAISAGMIVSDLGSSAHLAAAVRAAGAITGLMPHAAVANLRAATTKEDVLDQICAAMWRLRGMRDATLQLAKWNESYEVAIVPRDYVTRIERAAGECAEAIRTLGAGRSVPVPVWIHDAASKKKNGKKNGKR